MSRSVRAPIWTDGYGTKRKKETKRQANKTVRNSEVGNGANYKRQHNSWDICDYKFYDSKSKKVRRK